MTNESPTNGVEKHDLEQVWDTVKTLQDGQARTQSDLSGLLATVKGFEHKLDSLASLVTNIATRQPDKTNWVGIFAAIISAVALFGVFIESKFSPMQSTDVRIETRLNQRLEQIPEDYFRSGQAAAVQENHSRIIEKMSDALYRLVEDTAENKVRTQNNHELLRDVDHMGSRRHIFSAPDSMKAKGEAE